MPMHDVPHHAFCNASLENAREQRALVDRGLSNPKCTERVLVATYPGAVVLYIEREALEVTNWTACMLPRVQHRIPNWRTLTLFGAVACVAPDTVNTRYVAMDEAWKHNNCSNNCKAPAWCCS